MRTLLVLGFLPLVAACGGKADKPINTGTPPPASGCVAVFPDAGTANDVVCNIGWECSSNTERFQLICTEDSEGNESCTCSSDQTSETATVVVNSFVCQPMIALPVINDCGGFDVQM
jgi:hypothetical protein